jgi:hypothetical protein
MVSSSPSRSLFTITVDAVRSISSQRNHQLKFKQSRLKNFNLALILFSVCTTSVFGIEQVDYTKHLREQRALNQKAMKDLGDSLARTREQNFREEVAKRELAHKERDYWNKVFEKHKQNGTFVQGRIKISGITKTFLKSHKASSFFQKSIEIVIRGGLTGETIAKTKIKKGNFECNYNSIVGNNLQVLLRSGGKDIKLEERHLNRNENPNRSVILNEDGGIVIEKPKNDVSSNITSKDNKAFEKLMKLKQLYDEGIINKEEYEAKRKPLVKML